MVVSDYTNPVVYDLNGTAYYPTVEQQYTTPGPNPAGTNTTDKNGNQWSVDSQGNLIDTSGTAPVLKTSPDSSTTYYDVLGVNGARERYTIYSVLIDFNTAFKQSAVKDANGSTYVIQSITLPDGSAYKFTYDSGTSAGHYGEMTSMTLPSGGVINFNYSKFLDSYNNQMSGLPPS